jgi:hypothetical protein
MTIFLPFSSLSHNNHVHEKTNLGKRFSYKTGKKLYLVRVWIFPPQVYTI